MRRRITHRLPRLKTTFHRHLAMALGIGAVIRVCYVLADTRTALGNEAETYRFAALRLADGLGYTTGAAFIANPSEPIADHVPGWTTTLGVFSWFGLRSIASHQLVTVVVGLGLIAVIAMVGRRYFGESVGGYAALIAAVYPGFWLVEGQVLSEPLGLLLTGVLFLVVARFWEDPSTRNSVLLGGLCGLVILVRLEQVVLIVALLPVLAFRVQGLESGERLRRAGAMVGVALLVLSPWVIFNQIRFDAPVALSTNVGGTLLAGNCAPGTFEGDDIGSFDLTCVQSVFVGLPLEFDRSEEDDAFRGEALDQIRENIDRMPVAAAARIGRTLGVFHPIETAEIVAMRMNMSETAVMGWIVSYWALVPLAVVGAWRARRADELQLPLVAPVISCLVLVVLTYGQPLHHTPADLGVVVLAAAGIHHLQRVRRRYRRRQILGPD